MTGVSKEQRERWERLADDTWMINGGKTWTASSDWISVARVAVPALLAENEQQAAELSNLRHAVADLSGRDSNVIARKMADALDKIVDRDLTIEKLHERIGDLERDRDLAYDPLTESLQIELAEAFTKAEKWNHERNIARDQVVALRAQVAELTARSAWSRVWPVGPSGVCENEDCSNETVTDTYGTGKPFQVCEACYLADEKEAQ